MNGFTNEFRLAQLYGWLPTTDPEEIARYLTQQYEVDIEVLGDSRESGGLLEVRVREPRHERPAVSAPHRLAPDLLTLATALERALPDIPNKDGTGVPQSLFEHFADSGKDWLRDLILFCRGRELASLPDPDRDTQSEAL